MLVTFIKLTLVHFYIGISYFFDIGYFWFSLTGTAIWIYFIIITVIIDNAGVNTLI